MQPQNGQLSKGFIPVDKAIELIKKDTRNKATVDLSWMANNRNYIQENKNFRIPLMESDKRGYAHRVGSVYVFISSAYEKESLKQAIRDAFKARTNIELNAEGETYNKSTVQDDEYNSKAEIVRNPNPTTKPGDDLGRGETL